MTKSSTNNPKWKINRCWKSAWIEAAGSLWIANLLNKPPIKTTWKACIDHLVCFPNLNRTIRNATFCRKWFWSQQRRVDHQCTTNECKNRFFSTPQRTCKPIGTIAGKPNRYHCGESRWQRKLGSICLKIKCNKKTIPIKRLGWFIIYREMCFRVSRSSICFR